MKKLCCAVCATAAVLEVAAGENFVYPPDISAWSEQVKEQQALATVKMFADVQKTIKSGKKEYVIKPGNYRFGKNTKWLKCFYLYRVKNFTIKAEGVTFWIDATMRQDAVVLKECANVTLRGLTIDCDPFSYSQGVITGIDRSKKSLTVKLDPGFPPLESWKAGGNMKAPFFDRAGNFVPGWLDYVASFKKTDNGEYTVKLRSNYIFTYNTRIEPGFRMAFPDRSKRMAFNLINSDYCKLKNITVYNAPQMAFTEHGGAGGHHYLNCRVMRRPGTKRLITCNADLFHSIKTARGPVIENCDWAWSCDDLINIHGFFSYITEALSSTEFIVVQSFAKGDWLNKEIEFFNDADMKFIGKRKVIAMTEIKDAEKIASAKSLPEELRSRKINIGNFLGQVYVFKIKVDKPVKLKRHDIIQSYDNCGSYAVIKNNKLHDTLARGMLIRGDGAVVEGNMIRNTGYNGIQIVSDWYFMESAVARNITIRNNELVNCANCLHGRINYSLHIAAINTIVCHRNWAYAENISPIENVLIENNRIIDSGVIGITIGNVNGAKVLNNTIINPFARGLHPRIEKRLKDAASAIYVVESKNVELSGNRIEQLAKTVKPVVYGRNAKENITIR